ncbi:MAG: CehA/McbA family metallohydrolase [Deltaproteobacteria bacterium]|nr:CehA/McbA family metallohydrolase [Deltaproteobacteria bacterium]
MRAWQSVPLAAALAVFASGACRHAPTHHDAGGVSVEDRSDGQYIRGGAIPSFAVAKNEAAASIAIAPWPGRPTITIEAWLGGTRRNLVERGVVTLDGAAAIRHRLDGTNAELFLTIDPAIPAIVLRARAPHLPAGQRLAVHLGTPRGAEPVVLDKGAAWEPNEPLATTRARYAVVGPLVIGAPQGLDLVDGITAVTWSEGGASSAPSQGAPSQGGASSAPTETRTLIALSDADARALGSKLSGAPARTKADLRIDVRDVRTGAPLPSRVWLEGDGGGEKIVFDPSREAEPTIPLVDVTAARTTVSLPGGKWRLRATHGLGWSIARHDVDLAAGEVRRVVLDLAEEKPLPDWIGCDFHVHARGSFDAKAVSYEDRVRSLVAVGVDCAAATEHDHVGDHGPAAEKLHLHDRFRALSGVELTTVAPTLGHFNVFPWPAGAAIPQTKATTVTELFDAVRALPGSFVFQVNHPRMRNGDGTSIGWFDLITRDPKTGAAKGTYRRDYDAIEVFNGYDLKNVDRVRTLLVEWARMLDAGDPHVATGSSDSHGIGFPWAGFPRTLVRVGAGWRKDRPVQGVVDALKAGRAYVSSGPLLDVKVGGATLGDTVAGPSRARVAVAKSSWLGAPKVTWMIGADVVAAPDPTLQAGEWVAEIDVPKQSRKRPLIVIVEAPLIGEAPGLTGYDRALAVTNPVWLAP